MNAQKTEVVVNTAKYQTQGKVEVDGMVWSVKLPGAKTELRLSRAQRRLKLLDQKMADGSATEAEYDLYDELEMLYYDTFRKMFVDGTKDNSQVNKWIDETPLYIIAAAFHSIMEQAGKQDD